MRLPIQTVVLAHINTMHVLCMHDALMLMLSYVITSTVRMHIVSRMEKETKK